MKLILPLAWLVLSAPLFSQQFNGKTEVRKNPLVQFDHLSTHNGLSDRDVISIFQDRYGYTWFGTIHGLNKFDGYNFCAFYHKPGDSLSLSSDLIECMAEDPLGNLWMGTDHGLNRYDRKKNSFRQYFHQPADTSSLSGNHIRALYAARDSILWIETFDGTLHAMDVRTEKMQRYPHQPPYQSEYHYHTIYEDQTGKLWIGGRNLGIIYFDRDRNVFHTIRADETRPTGKRESDISAYLEDSRGNFWVSGLDGVYLLDRQKEVFRKVFAVSTWSMAEDVKGNLWLGTGQGLYQYNPAGNILFEFHPEPDNPYAISSNQINKVFPDGQGNIWAGTDNGLNRISRKAFPFEHYRHIPGNTGTLSSNNVSAVLQDHTGVLWVGTMGGGLNRFGPVVGTLSCFRHDPGNPGSLGSDKISCLYEDRDGTIWVGLWAGVGFQRFDRKNNSFQTWRKSSGTLKTDWYNDFAEDRQGNFYLGFWGGPGLTLFDRNQGVFLKSLKELFIPADGSRLINVLFTDSKGRLWIGTSKVGLQVLDPRSMKTIHYGYTPGDSGGLPGPEVNSILEDAQGMIWIGGRGVSRLNPETGSFTHFTMKEGLPDQTVMGMEVDQKGNLWISTRNGLSEFDPLTFTFHNFTMEDGLQENAFSRAHTRLASGEMIFGGPNGFTRFHPDSIRFKRDTSRPVIENFRVFNQLRQADLCEIPFLELLYHENFFSFELAAPAQIRPEGVAYVYRLEPLEKTWHQTDASNRRASYTSVPPGSYRFVAGIVQSPGGEPDSIVSVRLRIQPPFWKTWWFYLTGLLLALALIAGLFRIREKQLLWRNRTLELKQKLLRSQMNPHFIFNSLFAIQNFIYGQKADKAGRYLSDFAHLIRLILNNSREEYIALDKEIETIRLYLDLQSLRFNPAFHYTLTLDPEIDMELTAVPPMLAQPFIENSLEHGLRHQKGEGQIEIRFTLEKNRLCFEVADNGIGLMRSQATKREKPDGHKSLAMEITRERIRLLNRNLDQKIRFEITDRSSEKEGMCGTRVRFSIPYMDYKPTENIEPNN